MRLEPHHMLLFGGKVGRWLEVSGPSANNGGELSYTECNGRSLKYVVITEWEPWFVPPPGGEYVHDELLAMPFSNNNNVSIASSCRRAARDRLASEMALHHDKQLADMKKQRILLERECVRSEREAENEWLQLEREAKNEWLWLERECEKRQEDSQFD